MPLRPATTAALLLALAAAGGGGAPSPAAAAGVRLAPVTASATTPFEPSAVATGNLALATDREPATGYDVTVTRAGGGASGFVTTFAFDVSGFAAIAGFAARVDLVSDFGPIADFNGFLVGWIAPGDTVPGASVTAAAPTGVPSSATVSATAGGAGANDLSKYLSGGTLTLAVATELGGSGVTAPVSLSFREVTVDVQGTRLPPAVPAPGALGLFAAMLAGLAAAARRGGAAARA